MSVANQEEYLASKAMNASLASEKDLHEIEEVDPLRETVANFKAAEEQSEELSKQYAGYSLFNMNV